MLVSRINATLDEEARLTSSAEVKQNFLFKDDMSFEVDEYNRTMRRRILHITGNICEIKRIDVKPFRLRKSVWNVEVEVPLRQVAYPDQMTLSHHAVSNRTLFIFSGSGNEQRARAVGQSLQKLRGYCRQ